MAFGMSTQGTLNRKWWNQLLDRRAREPRQIETKTIDHRREKGSDWRVGREKTIGQYCLWATADDKRESVLGPSAYD